MKNLNKEWLALMAAGILFLVGFAFWNFMESVTGNDDAFFYTITQFPSDQLISAPTKQHLQTEN